MSVSDYSNTSKITRRTRALLNPKDYTIQTIDQLNKDQPCVKMNKFELFNEIFMKETNNKQNQAVLDWGKQNQKLKSLQQSFQIQESSDFTQNNSQNQNSIPKYQINVEQIENYNSKQFTENSVLPFQKNFGEYESFMKKDDLNMNNKLTESKGIQLSGFSQQNKPDKNLTGLEEKLEQLMKQNEELMNYNKNLENRLQQEEDKKIKIMNENYQLVFEKKNEKIRELIRQNSHLKTDLDDAKSVSQQNFEQYTKQDEDNKKILVNLREFEDKYKDKYSDKKITSQRNHFLPEKQFSNFQDQKYSVKQNSFSHSQYQPKYHTQSHDQTEEIHSLKNYQPYRNSHSNNDQHINSIQQKINYQNNYRLKNGSQSYYNPNDESNRSTIENNKVIRISSREPQKYLKHQSNYEKQQYISHHLPGIIPIDKQTGYIPYKTYIRPYKETNILKNQEFSNFSNKFNSNHYINKEKRISYVNHNDDEENRFRYVRTYNENPEQRIRIKNKSQYLDKSYDISPSEIKNRIQNQEYIPLEQIDKKKLLNDNSYRTLEIMNKYTNRNSHRRIQIN